MSKNIMRGALYAIGLLPAIAISPAAFAADSAPLNIGYVYVSPIGEAGWTTQQDMGRKEVEKNLGAKWSGGVHQARHALAFESGNRQYSALCPTIIMKWRVELFNRCALRSC